MPEQFELYTKLLELGMICEPVPYEVWEYCHVFELV